MTQFHEERRKGIGGSDAAAIMGLDPYRSPLEVYLEKIGDLPPKEESEAMHWGTVLEPIIADEYSRREGKKVRRVNRQLVHKEHDFLRVHVDRLIVADERGPGILECKNTNQYMTDEWKDGPPHRAYIQVLHGMLVTGYTWGAVAGLIGGNQFKSYEITRDEATLQFLSVFEREWWYNHVVKGRPPEGRIRTDVLNRMYSSSNGKQIALAGDEIGAALLWRDAFVKQKKEIESRIEECESTIKEAMKDAEYGVYDDGNYQFGVSWKSYDVKEHTVKAHSRRRFMVKMKEKEKNATIEPAQQNFLPDGTSVPADK